MTSCDVVLEVIDDIAPFTFCFDVTKELGASGNVSVDISEVLEDPFEGCGIASISLTQQSFDCTEVGTHTETVTVTDVNGNVGTCTTNITIEDNTAPTAICSSIDISLDASGNASITTSDVGGSSYDNCTLQSSSLDNKTFTCNDVGQNTVTLTLTDVHGNVSTCTSNISIIDDIAPTALCHDANVVLEGNGNGSISTNDVNNNSYDNCGIQSMSLSQTQFSCEDIGTKVVTLTVEDNNGNTSTCLSNVTIELSGAFNGNWQSHDIGQVTIGNDYWFDPCQDSWTYYVTGSGNNATSSTTDNVAFLSQTICGDGSIIAKIVSVDSNGYGGLMIRETTDEGAKQVAVFSNMANLLRHETRYTTNSPKQVNNFFKPNPVWLLLERQGDWIFSYSSYDGTNFQYVHGVFISMQNCLEVGLSSFTYMPGSQTEAVFSNVSITGCNGSFGGNNDEKGQIDDTIIPQHRNTAQNGPVWVIPTNLTLFPNPNQGQFSLQFENSLKERATLYIYNHYGQQVHSQQIQGGTLQL